ncbi:hypothetical protein AL486_19110 [Pandoraea apista]|nr:hypothetical protein AL486_19110 [Pandoraea apista]
MLNTQAKPNLDKMHEFFSSAVGADAFRSYQAFCGFLQVDKRDDVGLALAGQPGWGDKTAALFIRNLAIIEQTPVLRSRFWKDIHVLEGQHVALPVDSVISFIFESLNLEMQDEAGKDFRRINTYLRTELKYESSEILTWDDLWFWGFITQRTNPLTKAREHCGWNGAKYWAVPHSPKDLATIKLIEKLAGRFVGIVDSSRQT